MELTEADKELLKLIVRLSKQSNGRPPTLAEIAIAAGLQPSSRANIQRQLTRLRPLYANWTSSSRSLHVTPAGLAIIGMEAASRLNFPEGMSVSTVATANPASDFILPLLASGLIRMVSERISQGRPV